MYIYRERKEMTVLKFSRLLEYLARNYAPEELASRPITMYDLKKIGAVSSVKEGGIKLLGDVRISKFDLCRQFKANATAELQGLSAEELPFPVPPMSLIVSKASGSVIKAIEAAGGKIECRYHNRLGLRAILNPESL